VGAASPETGVRTRRSSTTWRSPGHVRAKAKLILTGSLAWGPNTGLPGSQVRQTAATVSAAETLARTGDAKLPHTRAPRGSDLQNQATSRSAMDSICSITKRMASGCWSGG